MLTLDKERALPDINPITKRTLELFVERVIEYGKNNLEKVILYGSVARNEAGKDSDIDVLVVLKEYTIEHFSNINGISAGVKWDMDFDENAYLQVLTVSEKETQDLSYYGLMKNISRDGVILYDIRQ
ncbi:hypothetical protein FACS1894187_02520 [Synergistales bacterium]|nr:hypothetical protein FACS1894187_02520 [Synergistales bacterium]